MVPASRSFSRFLRVCPCGPTALFAETTICYLFSLSSDRSCAVKTNAFRGHANLSNKKRDANEHTPLLNKCNVPNSSRVTLGAVLGFKENAQEQLWGESVQLPVLQSKHASIAGEPKAFQISSKLQSQNYVILNLINAL